jgi:hypothetical protein
MGPDEVVLVTPAVEGALAGIDCVKAGAFEQLAFERTVESLILALRLGVVRTAMADADAQAYQPDFQPRQRAVPGRSPGWAVVACNPLRQTIRAKYLRQRSAHLRAIFS